MSEAIFTQAFASVVKSAVVEALGELPQTSGPEAPVDRPGIAGFLGVGVSKVDALVAAGMPHWYCGDAPRFERAAVLEWFRAGNGGVKLAWPTKKGASV